MCKSTKWVVLVRGKEQLGYLAEDLRLTNSADDALKIKNEKDARSIVMGFLEQRIVSSVMEVPND